MSAIVFISSMKRRPICSSDGFLANSCLNLFSKNGNNNALPPLARLCTSCSHSFITGIFCI
ncbi:MAG: hypothetical protein FWG68_01900, partial [Defluviitaleaceae bacterium]|nr:hypothetical protein [Defluviitaleaceae bacterium]